MLINNNYTKRKNMVEVEATVVSVDSHMSNSGHGRYMVYQPTFEYCWKGFTRRLTTHYWFSGHNFDIGDKVTILIDPEDASNYRFKDLRYDPKVFVIRIVIFILIVLVLGKYMN